MAHVVVGRSSEVCVAVLVHTGPQAPHRTKAVTDALTDAVTREIDRSLTVRPVPHGVVVTFHGTNDDHASRVLDGLARLRDIVDSTMADAETADPVVDAQLLLAGLMSRSIDHDAGQEWDGDYSLYPAVAVGGTAAPDADGLGARLSRRLDAAFGPFREPAPTRSTVEFSPPARRWVHMPGHSGTSVRLYRPLRAPATREEALARSLANAIVGGTGNAVLPRTLREERQLSYHPYSILLSQGGHQWIVIDADTTEGLESTLISALTDVLRDGIEDAFGPRSIKAAAQFMLRPRRRAASSPLHAVQIDLARWDGSDPWSLADATLDEFLDLDVAFVGEVARRLFDPDELGTIGISSRAESDIFDAATPA